MGCDEATLIIGLIFCSVLPPLMADGGFLDSVD